MAPSKTRTRSHIQDVVYSKTKSLRRRCTAQYVIIFQEQINSTELTIGIGVVLHLVVLTLAQTQAPQAGPEPVSVFSLPTENHSGNFTFAINIPSGEENSHELYFHLSGPSDYSWVAVGTGSEMKNSLMFVLYSNARGDGKQSTDSSNADHMLYMCVS